MPLPAATPMKILRRFRRNRRGSAAVDYALLIVEDSGVRGFKFHRTVQGFVPSVVSYFALFAAIERLGVPELLHSGLTGIGSGMPG